MLNSNRSQVEVMLQNYSSQCLNIFSLPRRSFAFKRRELTMMPLKVLKTLYFFPIIFYVVSSPICHLKIAILSLSQTEIHNFLRVGRYKLMKDYLKL